jgi:hypothetical protein
MCSTNRDNALRRDITPFGLTNPNGTSPIWAGGMNVNGSQTVNTFTQTDLEWI